MTGSRLNSLPSAAILGRCRRAGPFPEERRCAMWSMARTLAVS
jgi:hypothetical protein